MRINKSAVMKVMTGLLALAASMGPAWEPLLLQPHLRRG